MTLANNVSRRDMLQSLAGLGTLTAMNPLGSVMAAPSSPPLVRSSKNLVIVVNMLGYNQHTFHPEHDKLDSSPLLSQLRDHYADLTVFKSIMQPEVMRGHNGGRGILTCNKNQTNGPYISLDQLAGEHLEQATRHKTLHMGNKTIVWNKNSRAVATLHELGPDKIYDHLFGQTPTDAIEMKLKSISAMRQSLPKKNREAYVASFEEHEQTLATDLQWAKKPIPKVEIDTKLHLTDHHGRGVMDPFQQHLELIRQGIKHRRGQIFVASPPFVDKTDYGVGLGYHALGHRAHLEKSIFNNMLKLEQHFFDSLSGFLADLKQDNLLEDTIVLFMGAFSSPGGHSREYLPTVLAGGGFNHQGLVECKDSTNPDGPLRYTLSELYVSILHQMGIDLNEFSGHAGSLDKILIG